MELRHPRFIILSEPRTGSNNVSYVLGAHPLLEVGNELFHPRNGITKLEYLPGAENSVQKGNYHWISFLEKEERRKVLDTLFSEYNGFKIHNTHIPPSLTEEIIREYECTVIVTYRNNIFEQAISNFVAIQKGKWHSDEWFKEAGAIEPVHIEPLKFFNWIERILSHRKEVWGALSSSSAKVILLEYDLLYHGDINWKMPKFLKILDVLEVPRFGQMDRGRYPAMWEQVLHYLDTGKQKMTGEDEARSIITNFEDLKKKYSLWAMDIFRKSF